MQNRPADKQHNRRRTDGNPRATGPCALTPPHLQYWLQTVEEAGHSQSNGVRASTFDILQNLRFQATRNLIFPLPPLHPPISQIPIYQDCKYFGLINCPRIPGEPGSSRSASSHLWTPMEGPWTSLRPTQRSKKVLLLNWVRCVLSLWLLGILHWLEQSACSEGATLTAFPTSVHRTIQHCNCMTWWCS